MRRFRNCGVFRKSDTDIALENESEVRIILYGHYRIAYLLRKPSSIDILGVFHGALDIDRYLP
ncbi:hypothetical protein [Flexistipes sinusarabici]|uniref:hypothetical protein n=1 Tax=Flexistipes sinusarabici TaxID=2352 RepID=UPI0026EFB7F3|nr:hypothetical protein [Flexistipes sinusarabici]